MQANVLQTLAPSQLLPRAAQNAVGETALTPLDFWRPMLATQLESVIGCS